MFFLPIISIFQPTGSARESRRNCESKITGVLYQQINKVLIDTSVNCPCIYLSRRISECRSNRNYLVTAFHSSNFVSCMTLGRLITKSTYCIKTSCSDHFLNFSLIYCRLIINSYSTICGRGLTKWRKSHWSKLSYLGWKPDYASMHFGILIHN